MTTIDVVIPAHNAAATIQESVRCARQQAQPPSSILVIADRCDDDTAALAEAEGARVVHSQAGSPAGARNVGLAQSEAEWVAFLDADDVWSEGWLSAVRAQASSAVDLIYGPWEERDVDDRLLRVARPPHGRHLLPGLARGNLLQTSACAVRRSALLLEGGFDERFRYGEDWLLWLRLAVRGRSALAHGPHVVYRRLEGSVTRDAASYEEVRRQLLAVCDEVASLPSIAPSDIDAARAWVLRDSALRFLSVDDVHRARRDLSEALRTRATSPELWALAAITLLPRSGRHLVREARRRARAAAQSASGRGR